MSERYGQCSPCAGPECFTCSGTGISGDASDYIVKQNCQEWEKEFKGYGDFGSAKTSQRFLKEEQKFYKNLKSTPAIEAAVLAMNTYIQKQKERKTMSTNLVTTENKAVTLAEKFGFSEKQLDLVKRTVAKGATDDELELFFYRCKELQLNPLLPGQVYFLKFGNSPGTVIIGLDGFRARAQRTGKLSGIKRGVIKNAKGECIGGWADVYVKGWDHPAHEEVALAEYADPRKQTWKTMPETMIKKVAEVAALRMAFPEDLGGMYLHEEMEKNEKIVQSTVIAKPSRVQITQLYAMAKENGFTSKESVAEFIKTHCGTSNPLELTMDQFQTVFLKIQTIGITNVAPAKPQETQPEIAEPGSDFEEEDEQQIAAKKEDDVPWAKYRAADKAGA